MKCPVCKHGETQPGVVTVTLQRGEASSSSRTCPPRYATTARRHYLSEEVMAKGIGPGLGRGRGGQGCRGRGLRYAA